MVAPSAPQNDIWGHCHAGGEAHAFRQLGRYQAPGRKAMHMNRNPFLLLAE